MRASQPPTRLSPGLSSGPRARPRKKPPSLRGFSPRRARVKALSSFLLFRRLYLGVGKMGVKFSGTDHLSLGRYWYTPAAMCERRREGWFM